MSNLRQAAQQALEVLETLYRTLSPESVLAISLNRRITALRAALAEPNKCTHGVTDGNCKECYMAEPEQEPVAWMAHQNKMLPTFHRTFTAARDWADNPTPLYAAPPKRKPLTEKEIWQIVTDCTIGSDLHADKLARAIEQAHGIKGEA